MADFTKEELEDLLICTYGGIHDDHPPEPWKEVLTEKIQSMIDNYCEHETREAGLAIGEGIRVYCMRCDATLAQANYPEIQKRDRDDNQ